MKFIAPNPSRALVGFASLICMCLGAGSLWGAGAAFFVGGLFMAVDCSIDEVVERVTRTSRFPQETEQGSE
jgi:hypothetical protein